MLSVDAPFARPAARFPHGHMYMSATLNELTHCASTQTDCTVSVLQTQLQTDSCLAASDCWNLTLLSTNITTPGSVAAIDKAYCHDKFGHWCLGKPLLSLCFH